jgi:hypothetical protein
MFTTRSTERDEKEVETIAPTWHSGTFRIKLPAESVKSTAPPVLHVKRISTCRGDVFNCGKSNRREPLPWSATTAFPGGGLGVPVVRVPGSVLWALGVEGPVAGGALVEHPERSNAKPSVIVTLLARTIRPSQQLAGLIIRHTYV